MCEVNLNGLRPIDQWELLDCNGHGPSILCVKWPWALVGIDGGERSAYANIQDGRRHHKVAEGQSPTNLCPESMSRVDGATLDRWYIYAIPRYPSSPAPAPCDARCDRSPPTQGGSTLWRLLVMNLPRVFHYLPRAAVDAARWVPSTLQYPHTQTHKCASDHSCKEVPKKLITPLLSAAPAALCNSGRWW